MKILKTLLFSLLLVSCTKTEYTKIGQEIIDGKVSAIQEGHIGITPVEPVIWVQTPTKTVAVEIPFEYEDKWKVGDDCLIIIEKYRENEK